MWQQSGQLRGVDAMYEIRKESLARVRVVSWEPEVSELRPRNPGRTEMGLTARTRSAGPVHTDIERLPWVAAYHGCAVACQDPARTRWTTVMERSD